MKSFVESVDIVHNEMLEKHAEMSQLGKNMWKGVGIGGLGGGALGAATADPGHRGAGFMTGATLGGLLGMGAPYVHELTPMAAHARKLEEIGTGHGHDMIKEVFKEQGAINRQATDVAARASEGGLNRAAQAESAANVQAGKNLSAKEVQKAKDLSAMEVQKAKDIANEAAQTREQAFTEGLGQKGKLDLEQYRASLRDAPIQGPPAQPYYSHADVPRPK